MNTKHPPISKITRPRISKLYLRKRLFRSLDAARKKPVVWISGLAGAGKTSLIAHYLDHHKLPSIWYQMDEGDADLATFFYYMGLAAKKAAPGRRKPLPHLTPEYMLGLSTFARRYFEDLCSRLKAPFVLVFDNYQEIPFGAEFHRILADAITAVPPGISICMISRGDPPSAFARLQGTQLMVRFGWNDLRFSMNESKQVIRLHQKKNLPKRELENLHRITNGWVSGIILLILRARLQGVGPVVISREEPDEVFDFFVNEVMNNVNPENQQFLMQTSFLPQMTSSQAQDLTGLEHGGRLLGQLARRNYFIERRYHPELTYQYHPLFRSFLLRMARDTMPKKQITATQKRAGQISENVDRFEDAAMLYSQAADWPNLIQLILKQAPSMASQGRNQTLAGWIGHLPDNLVVTDPWLLYWKATSLFPYSFLRVKPYFEKAFKKFLALQDSAGLFLSWASIVEAIIWGGVDFHPLDQWIETLEALKRKYKTFPTKEIEVRICSTMITALSTTRLDHPEIKNWATRGLVLAGEMPDSIAKAQLLIGLTNYYNSIGNITKLSVIIGLLESMVDPKNDLPIMQIMALFSKGLANMFRGPREGDGVGAILEGLEISKESGVHVWDFYMYGIASISNLDVHNLESARKWLARMESCLGRITLYEKSYYFFIKFHIAMFEHDYDEAEEHINISLKILRKIGVINHSRTGLHYLAKAHIKYEVGQMKAASKSLAIALRIARQTGCKALEFQALLSLAHFSKERGIKQAYLPTIRKALIIGKEQGYIYTHFDQIYLNGDMYVTALENNIEVDYVTNLIIKRQLIPSKPPYHIKIWPWSIRIHTLGRFEVEVFDKSSMRRYDGLSKPLKLLKAIIAHGCLRVSEFQLSDALWPDAEGDAAHISFTTTLHRLRKILGLKKAIRLSDHLVSLNLNRCWVDVNALDDLLSQVDENTDTDKKDMDRQQWLIDQIFKLYSGHFLKNDYDVWLLTTRQQLHTQVVRSIEKVAAYFKAHEQWQQAASVYERGIRIDPMIEMFYRGSMQCLHQMGRRAEALIAYRRCCKALKMGLNIPPSPITKSLGEKLMV